MKCYSCGVNKEIKEEFYTNPDLTKEMLPTFSVLDCQPDVKSDIWKAVVVCNDCFHRLDPDMWISQRCWQSLNPVIPFERLPTPIDADRWNVNYYPDL